MFEGIKKALGLGSSGTELENDQHIPKIEIVVTLGDSKPRTDTSDWPDEREAMCPSCEARLAKIPGAKTKCPACGKPMFVRTDPRSKSRRVVSESELEAIEEAWAIFGGYHDEYLSSKVSDEKKRETLRGELGREPSDIEFELKKIRSLRPRYLKDKSMGMYRNTYLEEAQLHYKNKNYREALVNFLAVVLLDGNGCANNIHIDLETLEYSGDPEKFSGFNKEDIDYLPYYADRIRMTLKRGELDIELGISDLETLKLKEITNCPEGIRSVWPKFKSATNFK